MRSIKTEQITEAVAKLAIDANYYIPEDIYDALVTGYEKEESTLGKEILDLLMQNNCVARKDQMPICQDTGMAVIFVELGQNVQITGGNFEDAINAGVIKGYAEGYLRKSVVDDPLFVRKNTNDNTPAVIHTFIVPGDKLKISLAPKGFGSENMSALKMLTPSAGVDGVKKLVVDTVKRAGSNPCPPIVIGLGIGGTMEKAALLAKQALLRSIAIRNPHPEYARLEHELLDLVNKTGIGPQGLGGRITALAVNIEYFPTHIAGLPVAVNINCHATRHAETYI